jgi:hypothetical protein
MFSGNGCRAFESALIRKGNTSVSLKYASGWIGFHSVDMEMLMSAWATRDVDPEMDELFVFQAFCFGSSLPGN